MAVQNAVLEDHALVIRDGRILDILPTPLAAERYHATAVLQRNSHLMIPGMVNAQSDAAMLLFRGAKHGAVPAGDGIINPEFARDGTLAAMAEMLKSGITCFCDRPAYPEETLRTAHEQGMRAVVGMPFADTPSPWANNAAESLTRSLSLRDKYKGNPLVSTAFAPDGAISLSDETFRRLATLADELDAGIMLNLHRSRGEIAECVNAHGMRPIERLWHLGLLSPALNAIHMVHLTAADMGLVQRTGISITLRPQLDLKFSQVLAPIAEFAAAGVRLGLGSGGALTQDLWTEMKLAALLTSPWDALHAATRGGAAVLGLESEVGSLEAGKWADLCCVDLSGPGTQPANNPLERLVFSGGRDLVSDVWVAGRQLLSGGELTRLDWPEVAARSAVWASRLNARGG
ncbi:MAG: 5-methylthioadenosine/S-adenosylhomocysteine deaminase [Gammaproteobacteria bacterium]|nr:5-methylthioadenosine/S-adenosylhomocysteine deaminase [Gammaproteobacteria bacterium]